MTAFAIAALAVSPLASYNSRIVPGVRIGQVKVGHELPAVLGQPVHSDGAAGHVWSTWVGSTGNTLDVYGVIGDAPSHLTRLVRVTSPWFRTSSGVRTGQTWGHIRSRYSASLVRNYDSDQFSRKLAILDNKLRGISFEVTVNQAGQVRNSSRCLAIWVHTAGTALDPATWLVYEPTRQ